MDKTLDEAVRERQRNKSSFAGERRRRSRRGVRKPEHSVSHSTSLSGDPDRAWVHDKYEDDYPRGESYSGKLSARSGKDRAKDEHRLPLGGAKLKVENIHYELGYADLLSLFERIAPVLKLEVKYDRAGRSEGICFVTYEKESHALDAIEQFDSANAHGQPIYLTLVSKGSSSTSGSKSLFDRISTSEGRKNARSRSRSPLSSQRSKPQPSRVGPRIDRYVPGDRDERDRPIIDRGVRRERQSRAGGDDQRRDNARRGDRKAETRQKGNSRPKKTIQELDEEMNDYWGNTGDNFNAVAPVVVQTNGNGANGETISANSGGDGAMVDADGDLMIE